MSRWTRLLAHRFGFEPIYTEECRSIPIADHIRRIYEKDFESYFFPGDKAHGQPFVHLEDLTACFRLVVEKRKRMGAQELFLIGEPETLSFEDMQHTLGELLYGKTWPVVRVPKVAARAGAWVKDRLSSGETFIKPWMIEMADDHYPIEILRARERLGWEPRHRLRVELQAMVEGLRRDPRGFYERNGLEWHERSDVEQPMEARSGRERGARDRGA